MTLAPEITSRPVFRGSHITAREAEHTWHDIGTALHLTPNGDAQQVGDSVAEAAFSYAVGHPDNDHARRNGFSVVWHCHSCDSNISDHGDVPSDSRHRTPRLAWAPHQYEKTYDDEDEDLVVVGEGHARPSAR